MIYLPPPPVSLLFHPSIRVFVNNFSNVFFLTHERDREVTIRNKLTFLLSKLSCETILEDKVNSAEGTERNTPFLLHKAAVLIFLIHKLLLWSIWSRGRENRFGYRFYSIRVLDGVVCGEWNPYAIKPVPKPVLSTPRPNRP